MGGLVLFTLWRVSSQMLGWLRRRLAGMAGVEMEPMPGAFRADMKALLKHLFARLLGFLMPSRRAKQVLPEIASVRQTYRHLLRWAAAAGYPRSLFPRT